MAMLVYANHDWTGKKMLETKDLILDKAKFSDWEDMYHNVWSQPESAKHMIWRVTTSESDAQKRILKVIEYQESHEEYLVYEKASGKAIGFAGVEELAPHVCQETGICLGPAYVRKGYGKQILQCLIEHCKNTFGAEEFMYSAREKNEASHKLAKSMGFCKIDTKPRLDKRDGTHYNLVKYSMKL